MGSQPLHRHWGKLHRLSTENGTLPVDLATQVARMARMSSELSVILAVSTPNVLKTTFLWGAIVLAGAVVLGVALLILRRKCHPSSDRPDQKAGFSMANLDRMRDNGEIYPEEFRALRAAALGATPVKNKGSASSSRGVAVDDEDNAAVE